MCSPIRAIAPRWRRWRPLRGAFPGQADEAAAILAWLVSPENSQMTGQILFADAGFECLARRETAQ